MLRTLFHSRFKSISSISLALFHSHHHQEKTHHIKIVKQVSEIIKTHQKWEKPLESLLSQEQIDLSELTPLVLVQIRDVGLALKFFSWVSNRSVSGPDSETYSSLLKILASSRRLRELDFVLKTMRDEEKLPTQDALNCLITVYSELGLVDAALDLFLITKKSDSFPNVVTCNSLLDALVRHGRFDIALGIYVEMLERDDRSSADNYSTCIMVKGFCRDGRVEEGRKLIEDRWGDGCIPNVVFYNTIIDGYCRRGDVRMACELFEEMKMKGFLPTVFSYGAIIRGLCKKGVFKGVDRLLSEMKRQGLDINLTILNTIVDGLCKCGSLGDAMVILDKMSGSDSKSKPDVVTFNTLISGFCREGKVDEAANLFREGLKRDLAPNKNTYTPLIHGYCSQGNINTASDLLIEMLERGNKPDLVTFGALIHGLVIVGKVDEAMEIREKMIERGVFPDANVYNVLMSGHCKKGLLPTAKKLLIEMLDRNILPDSFVYATLVDGFIREGNLGDAKKLFSFMIEKNINLDVVGYNAMIKGFCKFELMNDACVFLGKMFKSCLCPDEFTFTTIIDGHIKLNNMEEAQRIFDEMIKRRCRPNVVTYSAMINGFCRIGSFDRAQNLFIKMKSQGIVPNVVTYTILIGGFCRQGELMKASFFFEEMLVKNCVPNDVTYHYLINGLTNKMSNPGSIEEKKIHDPGGSIILDMFNVMVLDGWDLMTAAYSAIIACLCNRKKLKLALELRNKMLEKGFTPNFVTAVFLLHGLCKEGRSSEWKNILSFTFDENELWVAVKYSTLLDKYLSLGEASEASFILQSLVEEHKS